MDLFMWPNFFPVAAKSQPLAEYKNDEITLNSTMLLIKVLGEMKFY